MWCTGLLHPLVARPGNVFEMTIKHRLTDDVDRFTRKNKTMVSRKYNSISSLHAPMCNDYRKVIQDISVLTNNQGIKETSVQQWQAHRLWMWRMVVFRELRDNVKPWITFQQWKMGLITHEWDAEKKQHLTELVWCLRQSHWSYLFYKIVKNWYCTEELRRTVKEIRQHQQILLESRSNHH
jgi:hypothetical protein